MPETPNNTPPRPGTLGRDPSPGTGPDGRLEEGFRVQAPAVSLPKGGGAISGMGEKVSANPVTGSASVGIPLPLTPGRGGFTPSLGLSYDSGSGNSPFGLGWSLSRPAVRRKTAKGLPRYLDEGERADTYVLSDFEDLIPLLVQNTTTGDWEQQERAVTVDGVAWTARRYRPRVEGAFALIERFKRDSDARIFWRTISAGNLKRTYGKSDQARLTDPSATTHVFEWLLEEEADELGNVISYQYIEEDSASLDVHPADTRRTVTYRYLSRVSYGNTVMDENPDTGGTGTFRFHLVFDYGDHSTTDPGTSLDLTWPQRQDSFSSFRTGFDVRCHRLCQRILMLHDFDTLRDDGTGSSVTAVVRSVELSYTARATVTTLDSAQVKGWSWQGSPGGGSGYNTATLPAVSFTYAEPEIDRTVRFVQGLQELPNGLNMSSWQFIDLDGEGMAGLLSEQGGMWFYKRNQGQGSFAPAKSLRLRPNLSLGHPGTRLVDLDGDGNLDVVVMRSGLSGSQARTPEGTWADFRPFASTPNVRSADPNARFVDLDGDGHAELLVTEGDYLVWYPSQARQGYGAPVRVPMSSDEDSGPRFLFSRNGTEFFLADMSGDGLQDVARIRNGSVSYWPNLGYGRFGARIQMQGAPRFDRPDAFDPTRIRLADIDGSGPTDLVYVGPKGLQIYFNQAGNGWSSVTEIKGFPASARPHEVQVSDLLGQGTQCLVWSAPLLQSGTRPLRYMDLMAQGKPWLMTQVENGLGRTTTMTYTPSTTFYLADRQAGRPWATRLPFPVHCLSKLTVGDSVTGWRFVNEYAYHHGYFDGPEREFRGFGMVEQWDTETVSDYDGTGTGALVASQPPVRTRTWFHTGAWKQESTLTQAYTAEYTAVDSSATQLPEPATPTDLSPQALREAHRALKGRVLRQETYAEDGSGNLDVLYTVSQQTYDVVLLQPVEDSPFASFRVDALASLSAVYDLHDLSGAATPDPRVTHSLTLEVDEYGAALRTAAISYPRRGSGHDSQQTALSVVVSQTTVIHQDDRVAADDIWHIGVPTSAKTWELTGTTAWTDTSPATAATVDSAFTAATVRAFESTSTTGVQKRLLSHSYALYYNDALSAAESHGTLGLRALPYQRYALAFTAGVLTDRYGTRVTSPMLTDAGYVDLGLDLNEDSTTDVAWWIPSGRVTPNASAFYAPSSHIDPFGNTTTLTWDANTLALTTVTNAAGLSTTATTDYGRMAPSLVTDTNSTESSATFDALGRVLTTAVRNGSDGDATTAHSTELSYDTTTLPASVHVKALKAYGGSDWQQSWAYSDGGGNVVQTKAQAAPGDAPTVSGTTVTWAHADPRFIGTGRTVVDNKGNVVKQYEPFFSTTSDYETESELVEWGVSATLSYDPIGRNTTITLPDGNTRTWEYSPWQVSASDEEDNLSGGEHENTPTVTNLDALGRVYTSVQTPDGTTNYTTTLTQDIQGNVLTVNDPRGNDIQVQTYDILGRPCFSGAADEGYTTTNSKGESRVFLDITGTPLRTWRSGSLTSRRTVDVLRRPTALYVDQGSGEELVELTFYGDQLSDAGAFSQGRPVRAFDTAGEVTLAYDFKGRATTQTRTLISDITADADWTGLETKTSNTDIDTWLTANGGLESETFTVTTELDALDRPTTQTAPDASKTVPTYDEGGRLSAVSVYVRGSTTATDFVTNITSNAKGQRESITYGNNTGTTYTYDDNRLWLTRLLTQRTAASSFGAATLQDLDYTRDAVGNITAISDAAQETVFFSNAQVSATRSFAYDSLYRLTSATGREKVAQSQSTAFYSGYAGSQGSIPDTGSPALRSYTQSYAYDACGNITQTKHQQGSGGAVLWKRDYVYEAANNQLLTTTQPGSSTLTDSYTYTDRGAMDSLPHLVGITRDFRDQLRKADLNSGGDVAWYAYDAGGQRVRKVWDKGSVVEERIYLGGYEVWRKKDSAGVVQEERHTLHVMDDTRRIAMVETLTITGGASVGSPVERLRYQLEDQLGTASLEVDGDGGVITYEEYHPYGTVAWSAEKSGVQVSKRRYRYTGKEKDEETGLQYHSARYYLPWLGRWDRADPIGLGDGVNRWEYVGGRVTTSTDPTGLLSAAGVTATALVVSQLDSPAPGPADIAAGLILVGGLTYLAATGESINPFVEILPLVEQTFDPVAGNGPAQDQETDPVPPPSPDPVPVPPVEDENEKDRAFAHGTSLSSAIAMQGNLSEEAMRANKIGSESPGAFFTFEIGPPDNPGVGFQLAYNYAAVRAERPHAVLVMVVPAETMLALEQSKLVEYRPQIDTSLPPEVVFLPGAYATLNKQAQFQVVPIPDGN